MLAIKTTTLDADSTGTITVTFGQFEVISSASVSFDDPFKNGWAFAASRVITADTNKVIVTIKKQNLETPGAWAAAVAGDLTGVVLTIIAEGEV